VAADREKDRDQRRTVGRRLLIMGQAEPEKRQKIEDKAASTTEKMIRAKNPISITRRGRGKVTTVHREHDGHNIVTKIF